MAYTQFKYSPLYFAMDLYDAGFRVGGGLTIALAVAGAESRYNPAATNVVGNSPPSKDRGIVQINNFWHPEVSDECAFDPKCAAKEMWRLSKQGTDFGSWSAFQNGSYESYMPWAWVIVDALGRIQARDARADAAQQQINDLTNQLAAANQAAEQAKADAKRATDQLAVATNLSQQLRSKIEAARAALS